MEGMSEEERGRRGDGEEESKQDLVELEESLGNIHVNPEGPLPIWIMEVDLSQCPASYKENSPQERRLLAVADTFRRQYLHIYPDRNPLLLCPLNECGVEKFVSTTLRSTLLSYSELYSWDGLASFVADYLSLEPLEPPIEPPRYLLSPTLALQRQRGTCFDFSTLLCSLLLGAGYNAYCVSGYAVKEMCLLNQSLQDCPLLVAEGKEQAPEQKQPVKKYAVKPPRDLRSDFEKRQEERRQEEEQAALLKCQQEARQLQEEQERLPPDPLLGMRVHSWVLVLAGSREVPEDFFIDPLSGQSYSTSNDNFLGIESIWNQYNLWVNMQDCRYGCSDMVYDLGNTARWEAMLESSLLFSPDVMREPELAAMDDTEEEPKVVFEMPPSWVSKITISKQDVERRCPGGRKVTQYRKAKLERFAPYLLPDGLVTRLTTYTDLDCTQVSVVKEWYQNRLDHLEERLTSKDTNVTTGTFTPGRSFCLKAHRYATVTPETLRDMEFYSRARADGLVRRLELPGEMTETFQDRDDFLYYRHVVYGQRLKVLGPGNQPPQMVTERFHRDRSKPASEDVAERVFLLAKERIELTYHLEDDRIIPASRNFRKLKELQTFTRSMVSGYQVDPTEKPPTNLFLYELLLALMKEEEEVALRIKDSEKEVRAILGTREQEESHIELYISIYDTARNDKPRLHRENLERLAEEERQRQEKEVDVLAPRLALLGDPHTLSTPAAVQLRLDCLADFKQRLKEKASIIKARFQREREALQQKQQWYQQHQTMSKEEKDQYQAYCSEAIFRINIVKQRLVWHRKTAKQKYLALDEKLKRDPRLAPHLSS